MLILIFCWLKPIFGKNCLRTAQVANMAHSSLGRFSTLPRHRLMLDVVTKKTTMAGEIRLTRFRMRVFGQILSQSVYQKNSEVFFIPAEKKNGPFLALPLNSGLSWLKVQMLMVYFTPFSTWSTPRDQKRVGLVLVSRNTQGGAAFCPEKSGDI